MATSTSVARRSCARKCSPSPVICLNRQTNGGCGSGLGGVVERPLPGGSSVLSNDLAVASALRGRVRGRLARHGGCAWRDDGGCLGVALGDAVANTILVVSAVAGKRGHRACDLPVI